MFGYDHLSTASVLFMDRCNTRKQICNMVIISYPKKINNRIRKKALSMNAMYFIFIVRESWS